MENTSTNSSSRSSSRWSTIYVEDYEGSHPKCQDPIHRMEDCDNTWEQDAPPLIAIVGMGVRLPGGVRSPEDFWQLMIDKKCASAPVPAGRYNVEAFHGTPGVDTQCVVARNGYFLEDDYLGNADSSFFRHNKYEHAAQDPQQILLKEVVWECMENGGQVNWKGTDIGCFVGTFGEDWLDLTAKDTQKLDPLQIVGTGDYAVSNHVSYEYDLKGPSMTCRTACSSSLVALHEACQAITLGDCPSAIVGGTSLIFTPTMTTNMSQGGALSPEGKCKTFDESANGYARGEGICALFIKKFDDAVRDNDPIRGVIRAVATNFDGRTNHITVPSVTGQETLIRKAYRKAHIENPADTAFVECHGTATRVGDVVETTAVANAFGKQGMIITGVKPNIGHTEGAAGLAGLIKAVLALEHKQIPPNINFKTPNPAIMFEEAKLQVPVDILPWPKDKKERVSVNCFGVGGTNAHVIVDSVASVMESMPSSPTKRKIVRTDGPRLLVVSASHPESLNKRISETQEYLLNNMHSLDDLAYTLAAKREHLRQRAFAVVDPTIPVETNTFVKNTHLKASQSSVVFAFPGQGVQWRGMGTELLKSFPLFKRDMEKLDHILQGLPNGPTWKIIDEIAGLGQDGNVDKPELSQPLCTAIQIGLVNLLNSWGIVPSKVIGHSSGEFAAAYAANAISLEQAIILAYTRGVVAEMASDNGGMLAVALSRDAVSHYLGNDIVVACENSPRSVTLAGDRTQLEQLAERLRGENPDILMKLLPVERAYHSPHMALVGEVYENLIQPYLTKGKDKETMIDMHSTVLGEVINDPKKLDAAYWRRSLESPVLFATAFGDLSRSIQDQHGVVIEIASHPALRGPIGQILHDANASYIYCETLKRDDTTISRVLAVAGTIYMHLLPVDLVAVNNDNVGHIVTALPPYPWWREDTPWKESRISKAWRLRKFPRHELLGTRCLESSDIQPAWRNILKGEEVNWINEHRIQSLPILPAVAYVSMVSEAIRQITGSTDCTVRQLLLLEALVREGDDIEIMTNLRKMALNVTMDSDWFEFSVSSYNGQDWTKHCIGQVREGRDRPLPSNTVSPPFDRAISSWKFYRRCEKKGLGYGPQFEGLRDISAHPLRNIARGRVEDDPSLHDSYYAIHPTIVDQCLQVALVASDKGVSHYRDKAGLPIYIDRFYIARGSGSMLVEADTSDPTEGSIIGNFKAVSESTGDVVLDITGLRLLPAPDFSSESKLATFVQWNPDIRFLPAARQMPCPVGPGNDAMNKISQAVLLVVLNLTQALESQTSSLPYLTRYKEMITEVGRKIAEGTYDHIPGVSEVKVMDADERQEAFMALKDQMPSLVEPFYSKAWDYATGRPGSFIDGEVSQDTSLLEPIRGIIEWNLSLFDWKPFLVPLSHSNPSLRILEIGAGAGSSTAVLLEALTGQFGDRPFSKYTATDIEAKSLDVLRKRFDNVPRMDFAQLDISKLPEQQGFEPAAYDLVVVCNVLYETPILRESLDHIRSLLVPGGRLLVYEPCSEIPYLDILMGVLPRWWSGVGQDREDKPYVNVDRWEKELHQAGFSGMDSHAYNTSPPLNSQVVILSTNPEPEVPQKAISLICTPRTQLHAWVQDMTKQLSGNGYEVHWCIFGEVSRLEDEAIALLDFEEPFLDSITQSAFESFQSLMQSAKRLLWITHSVQIACSNPRFGLIPGVARTLRGELNIDFGTFEIGCFDDNAGSMVVPVYQQFAKSMETREYEFILHQGVVHTGRAAVRPVTDYLQDTSQHHVYELDIQTPGDLSTIGWKPVQEEEVGPDEVEVKAEYLSLNFKDLMMALGVVERTKTMDFCFETCGVITKVGSKVTSRKVGDRVVVLAAKPLRSYGTVLAEESTIVPEFLDSADVAATPTAYGTVFLTLVTMGGLRKGQSVLIHSACGAVGLAALNISKHFEAEIFASVGSEEKVQYLMENYNIPRSHIFDSHSDSFLSGVMQQTNGRGVDLVLNSLAGELLRASWQCVATFGKLFEIGKRDILGHGMLDLHGFQDCRSYCGFDLYTVMREQSSWGQRCLESCIDIISQQGINLPYTLFKASEVESALRYMQKGQHIGKLVLKAPEEGEKLPLLPTPRKFEFPSNFAYLLVGGLGGIGLSIVRWMVECGARRFVFLSRTAGQGQGDRDFQRELKILGCQVVMVAGSVTDPAVVEHAVSQSPCPIAGVVQLSAVLRDRTFDKMSYEDWTSCLAVKVQGTWNLHQTMRDRPLDFFVMFSSAASFIGNPGQANYSAANSFLDSFVQYRRALGLPASLVSLGPVDEMGLMAGQTDLLAKARQTFHHAMGERDVLKAFQLALLSAKDGISSSRPAVMAMGLSPSIVSSGPWLQQDAKFAVFTKHAASGTASSEEAMELKLLQRLASIQSNPAVLLNGTCESWIIESLGDQVATRQGNGDEMNRSEYAGVEVDSLASLHIKHWLRRKVEVEVSIAQIAAAKTVGGVAALTVDRLREKYGVGLQGGA